MHWFIYLGCLLHWFSEFIPSDSFHSVCHLIPGRCFSSHAEDMKNTYAPYCRNHDDVITVLEKLADPSTPPVITDYINGRLDKMREQMNVFDLAGVLIKPVQRILKYPLLLNELLKVGLFVLVFFLFLNVIVNN